MAIKARERDNYREHTYIHTGHQIRQENYTRYNRLTLAPRHIDYWRLRWVGWGKLWPLLMIPPDRANQAGKHPTHYSKAQPPHHSRESCNHQFTPLPQPRVKPTKISSTALARGGTKPDRKITSVIQPTQVTHPS